MSTITQQLTQLNSDREDLIDNLTTMGIAGLTGDETFTELVPQVLNIPAGSSQDFEKLLDRTITSIDNDNVTLIGNQAASNCLDLTTVNLPNVIGMGADAFLNCTSLTSVNMENLANISSNAFRGCSSLSSLYFKCSGSYTEADRPTITINSYAFYNCTSLVYTGVVTSQATSIGGYAFMGCSALKGTKGVSIIPDRLYLTKLSSALGVSAFKNCTSITKVTVGSGSSGITGPSVGDSAFEGCTSLTTADLSACNSIGSNAFKGCTNLTTLYLRKTVTPCTVYANSFDNVTGPINVYVPNELISSYKSANNWSTLYNNGKVTFTAIS